ncbi:MAG: DUF423 domain-containing protein [Pseudomonadota bacterium]
MRGRASRGGACGNFWLDLGARWATCTDMRALLACNIALALISLAIGGHWVEWHFRAADDGASRTSAFELGAQVHAATAIAAYGACLGGAPRASLWLSLIGITAFSGALYAFATLGWKATMPGTVIGTIFLAASWVWIALTHLRQS